MEDLHGMVVECRTPRRLLQGIVLNDTHPRRPNCGSVGLPETRYFFLVAQSTPVNSGMAGGIRNKDVS